MPLFIHLYTVSFVVPDTHLIPTSSCASQCLEGRSVNHALEQDGRVAILTVNRVQFRTSPKLVDFFKLHLLTIPSQHRKGLDFGKTICICFSCVLTQSMARVYTPHVFCYFALFLTFLTINYGFDAQGFDAKTGQLFQRMGLILGQSLGRYL
ncbi:hypothetical protein DFH11DRAFT_950308 [Phellopilus nigrolimitatus]|nr:hypothetical protein DFH11DRAFT_950308 [Phellopilus nigrolimitatus]